jgi:hypothetical protein
VRLGGGFSHYMMTATTLLYGFLGVFRARLAAVAISYAKFCKVIWKSVSDTVLLLLVDGCEVRREVDTVSKEPVDGGSSLRLEIFRTKPVNHGAIDSLTSLNWEWIRYCN